MAQAELLQHLLLLHLRQAVLEANREPLREECEGEGMTQAELPTRYCMWHGIPHGSWPLHGGEHWEKEWVVIDE